MSSIETAQQEKEEERKSNDRVLGLRSKWADAFQRAQKVGSVKERVFVRTEGQRLQDEIAAVREIQSRCKPSQQMHGFVWAFQR